MNPSETTPADRSGWTPSEEAVEAVVALLIPFRWGETVADKHYTRVRTTIAQNKAIELLTAARDVLESDAVREVAKIRRAIQVAGEKHYQAALDDYGRVVAHHIRTAWQAAAVVASTSEEMTP